VDIPVYHVFDWPAPKRNWSTSVRPTTVNKQQLISAAATSLEYVSISEYQAILKQSSVNQPKETNKIKD